VLMIVTQEVGGPC